MTKYSSNRSTKLTTKTDLFGSLKKANAIKSFFEADIKSFDEHQNKMFVLYGEWGSGKTSIIEYLKEELGKGEYHTVYFDTWKYEGDDNLALSLFELLAEDAQSLLGDTFKTICQGGFMTLKAFTNAISIKVPGGLFEFDGKKYVESAEKDFEKYLKEGSYLQKVKNFEEDFQKIENALLKKTEKKKIIIFIDDLDRCEPENVLNLLSAIKLLFTYGKETIFFCGIDKDAVAKAVQTKYKDVIKADEYLEKVFDISFNVPVNNNIYDLIKLYIFPDKELHGFTNECVVTIGDFLNRIGFINARHLKKVLNKFNFLRELKENGNLDSRYRAVLIPNISVVEDKDGLLETIFTLYFIILFEFYPGKFQIVDDIDNKLQIYTQAAYETSISKNLNQHLNYISNLVRGYHCFFDRKKIKLKDFRKICFEIKGNNIQEEGDFQKVLSVFTPLKTNRFESGNKNLEFISQFTEEGDQILLNFCKYLIEQKNWLFDNKSEYVFGNFIEMAKTLL